MRTHYVTVGLTLLMLTGAVVAADDETRRVHCKGGATFTDGVETNIDTNGDSASATLSQGAQVCNIGRFIFQDEVEWIPRPPTSACPAGTTNEFYIDATHGQQRAVATNQRTGNQLFGQVTSGTLCINFSTTPPTFTASGRNALIGGTGQYAGATGTGRFRSTGSYLQFGCKGGCPGPFGGFGQYTFTSNGTLTLPNDR